MVSFIYKQKIKIMILSILLIVSGLSHITLLIKKLIFDVTLMAASVIGVLPIAISAFQALKVKVISIDLLVTIAVLGAFIIKAYEESAIVTFLFLFGAYLEQRTLNKTRSAIKALTEMAPETALKKMDDGEFLEVGIDDVEVTDILLVKTGAKVPGWYCF